MSELLERGRMTDFQRRLLDRLERCRNGSESVTVLAAKLNTSRVAVVSAARALEKRGLVCSFRSDRSEWAALKFGVTSRRSNALGNPPASTGIDKEEKHDN